METYTIPSALLDGLQGAWTPAIGVASIVGASLGAYFLMNSSRKPAHLKDAPGPPGLPVIGHMAALMREDVHRQVAQWANEYGGVYKIVIAGPTYVVSDATLIGPLLRAGDQYLKKSQALYDQSKMLSLGEHSIFNDCSDGDVWYMTRKTVAQCFSTDAMKQAYPIASGVVYRMMSMWESQLKEGKDVMHVENWMQRCTLDITGLVGFKYDFQALEKDDGNEFIEAVHAVLLELSLRVGNPFRGIIQKALPFLPSSRKVAASLTRANRIYEQLFQVVKARGEPAADDVTMGAAIMRLKHPKTGQLMPEPFLKGNLATLLLGGYDTSAFTCTWILYDIARSPEVQRRVARELRDAGLLHVPGGPAPRELTYNDLPTLPVLNACIKESMRLHPAASTGTFRDVHRDIEIGGYWVPKGSKVWVPFYAPNCSEVNFTDPMTFAPDRWLDGEQGAQPAPSASGTSPHAANATFRGHAQAQGSSAHVFSEGTRSCAGQALAWLDVRTITISLLSRFWFEVDASVGSHEEVEREQVMALVLTPGKPMKLRIRHHNSTIL